MLGSKNFYFLGKIKNCLFPLCTSFYLASKPKKALFLALLSSMITFNDLGCCSIRACASSRTLGNACVTSCPSSVTLRDLLSLVRDLVSLPRDILFRHVALKKTGLFTSLPQPQSHNIVAILFV